jgi:hypothetical protein
MTTTCTAVTATTMLALIFLFDSSMANKDDKSSCASVAPALLPSAATRLLFIIEASAGDRQTIWNWMVMPPDRR